MHLRPHPSALLQALAFISAAFLSIFFETAGAQTHTSLFGWNDRIQQTIFSQYHNYGGPFYDRGLYRFYTPVMSKEHDMDLVTYDFSFTDDYLWYHSTGNSVKMFAGSFDLGEFLHGATVRNRIPVAEGLVFPLLVNRRYDMRTDRTVVWLGLDYTFREWHALGFRQSLTEQKADLNGAVYYRFGTLQTGWVETEFAFIDWPNNAIYALGEQRGTDYLNRRKHEKHPYMISFKAASPVWNNFRGELMGGLLTLSRSRVGPLEFPALNTSNRQRSHYFGALGEWANKHLTAALTWQTVYASFRRTNWQEPDDPARLIRYGNFQWMNTLGGILIARYGQVQFYGQLHHSRIRDREREINPRPSQWYANIIYAPFDYREQRWTMRYRLSWLPVRTGFTASVEWTSMYHDMGSDYEFEFLGNAVRAFDYRQLYELASINERLTLILGWRLKNGNRIEMGASYDVDGDREQGYYDYMVDRPARRFDGGFGRMIIFW
jgi:hypothetical protein